MTDDELAKTQNAIDRVGRWVAIGCLVSMAVYFLAGCAETPDVEPELGAYDPVVIPLDRYIGVKGTPLPCYIDTNVTQLPNRSDRQ